MLRKIGSALLALLGIASVGGLLVVGTFGIGGASSGFRAQLAGEDIAQAPYGTYPSGSVSTCPALRLFGVRGSGEHNQYGGRGSTIDTFARDIADKIPGTTGTPVDYPAIDVPLPTSTEIAEAFTGGLGFTLAVAQYGNTMRQYHSAYEASLTAGVGALLGGYNAYERKCPLHLVMFAGYSQGADVTAQAYAVLPAAQKRHVILVNFGDPHFNQVEGWVEHGGYSHNLQAILVHWWGEPAHSYTSADASHVGSWCAAGDVVCNWSWGNVLSGGIGVHIHEYASQYDAPAASWAYAAWRRLS